MYRDARSTKHKIFNVNLYENFLSVFFITPYLLTDK